jgi:hypothetical protein
MHRGIRNKTAMALAAGRTASGFTSPAFCNGLDSPPFTRVITTANFEIRHYPAQQWVSYTGHGPSAEHFAVVNNQEGFNRLFAYISGANESKQAIEMTCPVTGDITPGAGPNCTTTFRVAFYVPYQFQGVAPAPTDPSVSLFTRPEKYVAVRSFGGFVYEWRSIAPELQKLGTLLDESGITFNPNFQTVCRYNSPFQMFNRHNEVWLEVDPTSFPKQA